MKKKRTTKFNTMCEIYKLFCGNRELDFSDQAKEDLYIYETFGKGDLGISIFNNNVNGFAVGKKLLNITVTMWLQGVKEGLLFKSELYADGKYPKWWLDSIFSKK